MLIYTWRRCEPFFSIAFKQDFWRMNGWCKIHIKYSYKGRDKTIIEKGWIIWIELFYTRLIVEAAYEKYKWTDECNRFGIGRSLHTRIKANRNLHLLPALSQQDLLGFVWPLRIHRKKRWNQNRNYCFVSKPKKLMI